MKKMLSLFAATVFAFAAYAEDAVFKPFDMTVGDFFVNPIGYDLKDLAFSWKLPLERNGVRQTAYQIVVADSEEALERNPVWNSKKVENSRSVKILYNGKPLDSRKKCTGASASGMKTTMSRNGAMYQHLKPGCCRIRIGAQSG